MAKKVQQAKKSFYEVVFQGKPKVVRAFLAGLVTGADYNAEYYFSFEAGVHHEDAVEHLKEKFHLRALDCHVIVDTETSKRLKKLDKALPDLVGLTVTSHRHIRNASLAFRYEAFAKRYDDEIVAAIKNRPEGLRLKDAKRKLEKDPKAEGVEAYTAVHDYDAKGSGTVVGAVDKVIAFRKVLAKMPLIQAKKIDLNLA